MSKKNLKKAVSKTDNGSFAFSFGDPEPLNQSDIGDLLSSYYSDFTGYYFPPISLSGLAKLGKANATHGRCINFKTNQMGVVFIETGLVSFNDFVKAAMDLETFGNAYFKCFYNVFNELLYLKHLPALNMRVGRDGAFKLLRGMELGDLDFAPGEVLHAKHYDPAQGIYGVPTWLGALQDAFLNSEASLFRRRYYLNGSHMGYIFYTSDPNLDKDVEKEIRKSVQQGKGVGNFRSMFINIPNGKEKAVQIIPVGDISQKDEFEKIKNISADDVLVGHGVQASLAGVKPNNTGGFGDIEKIEKFYRRNEVPALVRPFTALNSQLPANKQFKFNFMAGVESVDTP